MTETGNLNKGIVEVEPLWIVNPISLILGIFEVKREEHWVYLMLKEGIQVEPFFIPQNVKKPFLTVEGGSSVVCIPYTEEQIYSLRK
jgi:hypothetical protein